MARPPKKAVERRQSSLAKVVKPTERKGSKGRKTAERKTAARKSVVEKTAVRKKDQKPEVAAAVPSASHASGHSSGHGESKRELVVLTGLSGSGKASALKAFEDLGYFAVDNLPVELLPHFAALVAQSTEITRAALVVDVREGQRLERFPAMLKELRRQLDTTVVYLEASEPVLLRRFSETRRPHPLGREERVGPAIQAERKLLDPVRNVADILIDTSRFNVHELRAYVQNQFKRESDGKGLLVSTLSFGYKNGVPLEADLVFDVRFLPNPHFVPEFRKLTGRHPKVVGYVGHFPQTKEFLDKVTDLLLFLLPHYINEGKSYLTVAFGCTGGQHRSVMIAEEMKKRLARENYQVKAHHRDMPR
ncbi:RNase adapter RapZ [Silvibacterium sp.]|uniref:RNase adapter RapZ n=1 Tax=Silvibacterium sp. TaxID=1964179 RepID=UPI0039E6EC94